MTGGVERCVVEDVGELVAAGHDVEVWHRAGPDGDPDEGRAVFDRLGVRLRHARDYRFGIRTAPTDVFRFVREGLRLRRSRPDVLWLNRPEFLPWGRVVSFVSGVPLAVHLHHAPNYRRLGPFAGGRTRYLAVSAAMARAWTAVGAPPDRVDVVPNGVDTAAFPAATPASTRRARAALGLDQDRPVVLYYGRLTRSKGVLALLEAWGRVHASARVLVGPGTPPAPAPVLVLAGALYPQDAPAVHRAIAALPEGSVVVVPERDDVVPLLHAADVVVAPSIEPEGFGRVVVEAMSTGRPVVAAALERHRRDPQRRVDAVHRRPHRDRRAGRQGPRGAARGRDRTGTRGPVPRLGAGPLRPGAARRGAAPGARCAREALTDDDDRAVPTTTTSAPLSRSGPSSRCRPAATRSARHRPPARRSSSSR
ncbi:glycosyltransferase family 4 protein [Sphingomonas sp. LR61]